MDYEPDHSGRPIRFFDVLVTLVLGGVVFAQIEIWRALHPETPAAPVALQGPLVAVAAAKSKAVKRAKAAKRSRASAMVISSRPRLAQRAQRVGLVRSTKGKAIHLPGGKARFEKPRDEFVPEVNPAEVPEG